MVRRWRCGFGAFFPSSLEEGWREAPGRLAVCSTTPPAVAGTPPHPRRGKKISPRDCPGSPGVDAVQVFHADLARRDFAQCDDRRLVARGLDVRRAALGELTRAVGGRERQLEAVGDSL